MSGSVVAEVNPEDEAGHLGETSQEQTEQTVTAVVADTLVAGEEQELQDKTNKTSWEQRRLATLTRQRHEAERRAALAEQRATAAETRLASLSGGQNTTQGTTATASSSQEEELAQRFNAAVEERAQQQAFDAACNDLYNEGNKKFNDFVPKIQGFQKIGGLPPQLVEAALELGDAHDVLYALANDLDEAARIVEITSPVRQATALSKFVEQRKLAERRATTKAPDPITPVQGHTQSAEKDPEKMSMTEWLAWREADIAKKKAAKQR